MPTESEALLEKSIVYSNELGKTPLDPRSKQNGRGFGVYEPAQLISQYGRLKTGETQDAPLETPYFYLTLTQRVELAKLSTDVFSIVTNRMNRISALDFQITPIKKQEDRIADELKGLAQVYNERRQLVDFQSLAIKAKCYVEIMHHLPDILPDFSNFSNALYRWKKAITYRRTDEQSEIHDWLQMPIMGTTWDRYAKKFVFDLLVHGAVSTYKQVIDGKLENFDTLPGGTVYRFKNRYFSAVNGYIQMIPGEENQIMFENELSYCEYLPTSAMSHSLVPMEALINKLTETLLFDKLMSDQADGSKPPEKLVIITNNADPFGDFDNPQEAPVNPDEQKRIELKLNTPRKYAVATLTGNNVSVVDLTRENTMAIMMERQTKITQAIGSVFQASNVEMNLTGSDSTNGRESGWIQQEISQGKGIAPILKMLSKTMTTDIITHRFGYGYQMEYSETKDAMQQAQLDSMELANGTITINEVREREGLTLFDGDNYNLPSTGQSSAPDGSPGKPLNMKAI